MSSSSKVVHAETVGTYLQLPFDPLAIMSQTHLNFELGISLPDMSVIQIPLYPPLKNISREMTNDVVCSFI
jgi:hypothetical protein